MMVAALAEENGVASAGVVVDDACVVLAAADASVCSVVEVRVMATAGAGVGVVDSMSAFLISLSSSTVERVFRFLAGGDIVLVLALYLMALVSSILHLRRGIRCVKAGCGGSCDEVAVEVIVRV